MRMQGTIPCAPADDLTTISVGEDAYGATTAALLATYEFLNAFGGKVRIQKTWAFASNTNIKARTAIVKFPRQPDLKLAVVHEHRDLGGHLDFTKRRTSTTTTKIIKESTNQCRAMAHFPGPRGNNHRLNVKKFRRPGLYGISTAPENLIEINK